MKLTSSFARPTRSLSRPVKFTQPNMYSRLGKGFMSVTIFASCRHKGTTGHAEPYAYETDVINKLSYMLRTSLVRYILPGIICNVEKVCDVPKDLPSPPEAPHAQENQQEMCFGSTGKNKLFVCRHTFTPMVP